jgi:hypothetical protein
LQHKEEVFFHGDVANGADDSVGPVPPDFLSDEIIVPGSRVGKRDETDQWDRQVDAEVIVEGLRAPMGKQHQCYRRRQKNEMEGKVAHLEPELSGG